MFYDKISISESAYENSRNFQFKLDAVLLSSKFFSDLRAIVSFSKEGDYKRVDEVYRVKGKKIVSYSYYFNRRDYDLSYCEKSVMFFRAGNYDYQFIVNDGIASYLRRCNQKTSYFSWDEIEPNEFLEAFKEYVWYFSV